MLVVLVPARRGGKKEIARGQSERDAAGSEGEGREGRDDWLNPSTRERRDSQQAMRDQI